MYRTFDVRHVLVAVVSLHKRSVVETILRLGAGLDKECYC
jgi:hypothetical protein